jgi:cyanophycinase
VFIPTAGSDEEIARAVPPAFMRRSGASVSVLHTRDRAVADSEGFVAPLRTATAVFFMGGRQWRLVDAYAGTRTEREFRGVLDRGGEIAGSSAGASIQASYLVRGSPSGNEILMAPGHERGFGYLVNAAIDQHVRARGRADDLARIVAAHPELLGIGIDEGTAIIVEGTTMTVIGPGEVLVTDGASHDGAPYLVLTRGMRYDLANWRVMG